MREQELREKIVDTLNATEISVELEKEDIYKFADALIANKFGRIVSFAEYVGSKIAGHSNYHGDSILCALYCAAEGKEIHTVKPLDITEYGYNVLVKERDEYKHRAEVAEKIAEEACEIVFCEAIDNEEWDEVIRNYKETKEKYSDEFGITDEMLYDYLHEKAEKKLQEERKDA